MQGLSDSDLATVASHVHLLIHCAANVDFNERLDGAITTNCRGPLRMLKLAEKCSNLLAYVHVSTAYVNCNQPTGSKVLEELPQLQGFLGALSEGICTTNFAHVPPKHHLHNNA